MSSGPCDWARPLHHAAGNTTRERQNHIETNETHASITAHGFISQDASRLNLVDTRTYSKHCHWYGVRDGAGSVSLFNMADAGDAGD